MESKDLVLRKKDLSPNKWYKGQCRNADTAYWDGINFKYIRHKLGYVYEETIPHPEDYNGFDMFIATELK